MDQDKSFVCCDSTEMYVGSFLQLEWSTNQKKRGAKKESLESKLKTTLSSKNGKSINQRILLKK